MLEFLRENIVTIITVAVLLLLVFLAVRKMVKDKKSGIGPCGKRCSECSHGCDYSNKKTQ